MLATFMSLVLSAGAGSEPALVSGPVEMRPSQIREYNRNLARDHPNYIRCAKIEVVGSLVKKKVCRTNEEWRQLAVAGNRDARELVESLQKGWSNGR